MDKIKKLIAAGASHRTAIKESLGMTVSAFAEKKGLPRATLSDTLGGRIRPTDAIVQAFVEELGGTPDEWRMLLWESARPVPGAEEADGEVEVEKEVA